MKDVVDGRGSELDREQLARAALGAVGELPRGHVAVVPVGRVDLGEAVAVRVADGHAAGRAGPRDELERLVVVRRRADVLEDEDVLGAVAAEEDERALAGRRGRARVERAREAGA